jgi:dienelactone hydrolase
MSCTMDAIDKNDYIDAERVAVVGGSHGGEILQCYVTRSSKISVFFFPITKDISPSLVYLPVHANKIHEK